MAKKKTAVPVAKKAAQHKPEATEETKATEQTTEETKAAEQTTEETKAAEQAPEVTSEADKLIKKEAAILMADMGVKEIWRCPVKGYWFTRKDYATEHEKTQKTICKHFKL